MKIKLRIILFIMTGLKKANTSSDPALTLDKRDSTQMMKQSPWWAFSCSDFSINYQTMISQSSLYLIREEITEDRALKYNLYKRDPPLLKAAFPSDAPLTLILTSPLKRPILSPLKDQDTTPEILLLLYFLVNPKKECSPDGGFSRNSSMSGKSTRQAGKVPSSAG